MLLLTMLAAIYGAIFSAQRLTRPVQALIAGTRAVGKGDFATRLPLPSRDEMGFLVASFNDMTKRLKRASDEAARSREAVEHERERLAVILSRSPAACWWSTANCSCRAPIRPLARSSAMTRNRGRPESCGGAEATPRLTRSSPSGATGCGRGDGMARAVESAGRGRQSRIAVGLYALAGRRRQGGLVIVFEEITALLTAQRNAAWARRRLAHGSEPADADSAVGRALRRKLRTELSTRTCSCLTTHTIVQQVDACNRWSTPS
jgi:nitrogen fixation/metabolism regulation signal transduction histidine kinase